MADRKRAARKRAVGTRERVVAYLAEVYELFDPGGMASAQLAAAVGYPGSSVAFAQLLSGMERSGLIERDVRGKRTYRIRLGSARGARAVSAGSAAGDSRSAGVVGPGRAGGSAPGTGAGLAGLDYDELARRLLAQVVRRLAGTGLPGTGPPGTGQAGTALTEAGPPGAGPPGAGPPGAGPPGAGPPGAGPSGTGPSGTGPEARHQPESEALREKVADLEYELARAWTKNGKLAGENARLREQLRAAQHSLALAGESLRRLPTKADLDSAEVVLLQRLLTAAGDGAGRDDARPLGA